MSHTHSNIAFAVNVVIQYMHTPKLTHFKVIYRILRYLKGTTAKGILFKKQDHLQVKVILMIMLTGQAKKKKKKKKTQSLVARSRVEADFRTLPHGFVRVYTQKLLKQSKFSQTMLVHIYCGNKATISIAHNPFLHDRTKHIEVDKHFLLI